ncbi:MAG: proline dehydrogenase family protein [Nitrososphaerales archaeon]
MGLPKTDKIPKELTLQGKRFVLSRRSVLLRLARQWIAGESASDGIERIRRANEKGILGLLNLLGEHVESREQVSLALSEYGRLFDQIHEAKVDSQVSVKPTQLGINIDYEYCVQNYLELSEKCQARNNWLWIDMEDSRYVQKTIDLYSRVLERYSKTGLAIQAYLKRSVQDVSYLLSLGANIRLVKGAYNESADLAFKDKALVRKSYTSLLDALFAGDQFFAVATHDGTLVEHAKHVSLESGNNKFEFEMLMGVRDSLKEQLVAEKYQVREYVPYGPDWLAYSIRRMREKKSNILLLGRSVFSR